MKYQKALLCIALAGTLIFSGCGSTNNSTGNNTNTSSSVESTVETSTEDTDAKSDENTVTGMISEITDSTITVAAMPGGGQGETPGNPPSDNKGGAPADNGNSDNSDSTEAPDKPDSDGADSTETPGNLPSGDNNSAPSNNGGAPDMSNMTTETINLTDSTIYYDKDGKEKGGHKKWKASCKGSAFGPGAAKNNPGTVCRDRCGGGSKGGAFRRIPPYWGRRYGDAPHQRGTGHGVS